MINALLQKPFSTLLKNLNLFTKFFHQRNNMASQPNFTIYFLHPQGTYVRLRDVEINIVINFFTSIQYLWVRNVSIDWSLL